MLLSPLQAAAVLDQPAAKGLLDRARQHEARLRLHVHEQPDRQALLRTAAMVELLAGVEALLPKDKYAAFLRFVGAPLPTIEVTRRIFTALGRVFEAHNSRFSAKFDDPALVDDFAELRERLGDESFWGTRAFEAIKTAPHSLVVVDLPAEPNPVGTLPEPYYYLLPTAQLIDVRHRPDGKGCDYAAFWIAGRTAPTPQAPEGMRRAAVLDDVFWRVYAFDDTRSGAERWQLLTEVAHGLGYCPARALWPHTVADHPTPEEPIERISRAAPLTAVLDRLDKYVFWHVSTSYFRAYGAWPILWQLEEKCGYRGPQFEECEHGIVNYRKYRTVVGTDGIALQQEYYDAQPCPTCKGSRLMGPGTVLHVPVPSAETGDTRNPAGMIVADAAALELADKLLHADAQRLFERVAGTTTEATAAAVNEKQVIAGTEARTDVLTGLALALEEIHEWTMSTVARLRYGPRFLELEVSYGDEFLLTAPLDLAKEYTALQEAGAPAFVLAQKRALLVETALRLDPGERDRARILADLEPYQEMSIQQVLDNADRLDPELVALKVNFNAYVRRFEREQLDVRRFAAVGVSYDRKISLIQQTLLEYVRETPSPHVGAAHAA